MEKNENMTLLMRLLATKMTSHPRVLSRNVPKKSKLFSRYNESVNENILSCFSHYLWINPRMLFKQSYTVTPRLPTVSMAEDFAVPSLEPRL